MSSIKTWSTTAADNNSAAPDGWPEGQAPSSVNNCAREMMAAIRTQHEDAAWIDLGDTPTQTSATTFTMVGDVTTAYAVGRRIRCTDSSTLYGTITVSAYTSLTTITVVLDSGSLSGSLSAVALGVLDEKAAPRSIDGDLSVTGSVEIEAYSEDADEYTATTGTRDLDVSLATYFYPSADLGTATITFTFSNPASSGRVSSFTMELLGADDATLTWPASVEWPEGTEPTWTSGKDIVSFVTRDNGTTWTGHVGGLNF